MCQKIILSSWLFLTNNPLGLEGVVPVARILSSDHFMGTFVSLSGCQLSTAGESVTNSDFINAAEDVYTTGEELHKPVLWNHF